MSTPLEALESLAREFWHLSPSSPLHSEPILKGASGRTIVRLHHPQASSLIGFYHDGQKPENHDFVPLARWLREGGVPAPQIFAENGFASLVEDFGSLDLLEKHQSSPWPETRECYRSALQSLHQLHQLPTQTPFPLARQFDFATYCWEQDYFWEHLAGTHLGLPFSPEIPALRAIAANLASSQPVLVHRDFQSQNLMIRENDRIGFIDFQGLRPGHAEYDLASLLYDPYSRLTQDQRDELLQDWQELGGRFDAQRFDACALQRLMQALGAFGNIVHNRGDEWYRPHIPVATSSLLDVARRLGLQAEFAFLEPLTAPQSLS